MSCQDAAIKQDLLLYIDGHYKSFNYEDPLELFSDLATILKVHLPEGNHTPFEVARVLRNLALRTTPSIEFEEEFTALKFSKSDSIDDLQSKVAEMMAQWEAELIRCRELPLNKSRVKINQDLHTLLVEIA